MGVTREKPDDHWRVSCGCRTVTWDPVRQGDDLVVRCTRCNVRNRIPAIMRFTPPPAEGPRSGSYPLEHKDY